MFHTMLHFMRRVLRLGRLSADRVSYQQSTPDSNFVSQNIEINLRIYLSV